MSEATTACEQFKKHSGHDLLLHPMNEAMAFLRRLSDMIE
jgi:hypothetical protein